MCDVKKYEKIYEEIKCLEPKDTLQLTLEADSEEQREFLSDSWSVASSSGI